GHKTVVAGIVHCGVQEAIDVERAGGLIQFVLHRLAAHRYFDDHIDLEGGIIPNRNPVDQHQKSLQRMRGAILHLGRATSRKECCAATKPRKVSRTRKRRRVAASGYSTLDESRDATCKGSRIL